MEIVIGFVAFIAVVALGLSVAVLARLAKLEHALPAPSTSLPVPVAELPEFPLRALVIGLSITQDHERPVFVEMLRQALLAEDVADVRTVTAGDDISITGFVTCNGYGEIYYTAELTCATPSGPFCTLIEKPPHGDRQSNLALEVVAKLKRDYQRMEFREARRSAIRELGS